VSARDGGGWSELPDRFEAVERDTYDALLSTVEPVRLYRALWLMVAIGIGVLLGWIAAAPEHQLGSLLLGTVVIAFTILAVVRPYRAAQLFLVIAFSGWTHAISVQLPQTFVGGGLPLIGLFGFGWLIGGARIPEFGLRRYVTPLLLLVMMLVAAELVGSARDNLWIVGQNDLLPALALAAFVPLVAVLRTEREARGMILAAAFGLALLAIRVLATYVGNFDAHGEITTGFARILGEQGLAHGPRVLPSYHQAALLPLGFIGAVLAARPRGGTGSGRGLAGPLSMALGALFLLALLVTYSRSLMLTTIGAVGVATVLLHRQPKRAARAVLWIVGAAVVLILAVPLFTGRPLGSVASALRERFTDISRDESYTDRVAEDREGMRAFGTSPLIGLGLGADVVVPEYPNRLPGYFHNTYIGLLMKTGVVGTGIFLFVVLLILFRGVRTALRTTGFAAAMLAAGCAWLVGLLFASISEPFILYPPGFEFIAFLAAVVAFYESRVNAPAGTEEPAPVEEPVIEPAAAP
jgi:O-antigen ligase